MRRRHFLTGAGAGLAGLAAAPLWADIAGAAPLYLSAANTADNATWLVGLTLDGRVPFAHPLPGRGHAAAVHPERAEAVAFARRPGDFALVIDCATGAETARLTTPDDRHFYGHGAYTADGRLLLTTENAFDAPDGRIGVWDAENGYARLGDFASGGLGPHEILRLANGTFAVANGADDPFLKPAFFDTLDAPTLWRHGMMRIAGAGHAPFRQMPEAFNALLAEFAAGA